MIAQFLPPLLSNDVIKKSTGLTWIWARVRKHFSFTQSEVNFLKLHTIKKEDDERYETLFQRIIAHLDDNLLTVASDVHHDGAVVAADEIMSPTSLAHTQGMIYFIPWSVPLKMHNKNICLLYTSPSPRDS